MQLAERYSNLGTEKAFAVSAEAAALAKTGKQIFAFHIGDLNFETPPNIVEAAAKAMRDGYTGYCPNQGVVEFRDVLAQNINETHNTSYTCANVAVQPGGKPVIGKFLLSLMNPSAAVLYPNPGFPIYESLIGYFGGQPLAYGFKEGDDNFEIETQKIREAAESGTKLLILNDLHNPTGAEAGDRELQELAELARQHDMYVLCDESYFDLRYEGKSKSLVSLPGMQERCLILYTLSKKYSMTGWRIGAAIGPTKIIDAITQLNVNDESCTNHFLQYAAIEALTGPQDGHNKIIDQLKTRRDAAVDILNDTPGIQCYRPNATFYLYPNVTQAMNIKQTRDYELFRQTVLEATGVSFCTRQHFGSVLPGEQECYVRMAYSGIDLERIEEGLQKLKAFIES